MPDRSASLRGSDSKNQRLPPETKIGPVRAMTALDVLKRQGSTTALRDNTARSFASTIPTFQLGKRLFTRTASPQPSLMNVGRAASPSSSIDDLSLGSSPPPNGHRDRRRDHSTNGALAYKSAAQTDLPLMVEVALDPELPITPKQLIEPPSSSRGSFITAPAPTELTVLTGDPSTNPPRIVRDVIDKEVYPVCTDSTPPLRVLWNSTRVEITETPDGGMTPDPNMDDPLPLILESRGSELTMVVTPSSTGEETSDKTSGSESTPSPRAPSNSTLAEITECGIRPDPNTGDPAPWIPKSGSRGSEPAMVVALSPTVEETPDTTSGISGIGTGDHAPPTKSMHDDNQILNIIFFGETGAGKSSVINMLMNSDTARTSSAADGKTSSFESFITTIDGQRVRLWDTAGLNEAERGTVPAKIAMQNLRVLVGALWEGIALLVYCVRAMRFQPNLKDNYNLVHETICQGKVPVFIVVTGLENQVPMNEWWAQNETEFSQNGMWFDGHACVTSTRGKRNESGDNMYDTEFQESQMVLRKLIADYFATPRASWTIEDNKTWELETSSKIDNHYDGKNQRIETNVDISDGLPPPPMESWWEFVQSFFG